MYELSTPLEKGFASYVDNYCKCYGLTIDEETKFHLVRYLINNDDLFENIIDYLIRDFLEEGGD